MPKYKLHIAYDGTHYGGWQVQPNAASIQGLIEEALATIVREPTAITGAGRTDAGVHARGQVAHFETEKPFELPRLHLSLNALLPPDIRIMRILPTEETFHARYSALQKTYHYYLHTEMTKNPFNRLYTTHFPYPFDLKLLEKSTQYLVGEHDFTSFSNDCLEGAAGKNPLRTLKRLEIKQVSGGLCLQFVADGFLYKMVRNITGTLLDIASGKFSPEEIPDIMNAKDRKKAGRCAPAQGLFLMEVLYPAQSDGIFSKEEKWKEPALSGR